MNKMKKYKFLVIGIIVVFFLSCGKKNNRNQEDLSTKYYGTWYRLNETADSIRVIRYNDSLYGIEDTPLHSIVLSRDSLCDNYPMEQECWPIKKYIIDKDSLKVSGFTFYDLDIIRNIATVKIHHRDSSPDIYKYIRLENLNSFPKSIIIDNDDSEYKEPQTDEEFLESLDRFAKENPPASH